MALLDKGSLLRQLESKYNVPVIDVAVRIDAEEKPKGASFGNFDSSEPMYRHLASLDWEQLATLSNHVEVLNEMLRRRLNSICGVELDRYKKRMGADTSIWVPIRYPLPDSVQLIKAGQSSA